MLPTRTPSATIIDEVTSWPGITAVDGDRGELSFRLGKRELGHLHGDVGDVIALLRLNYDRMAPTSA